MGGQRSMNTLDKRMIHILGGIEQDEARFHHATQNGARFKTYKLLLLEFFI